MGKIIKEACILFAITLIAGLALGFVYDITKAPIAKVNEDAKQAAYKAVITEADSFEAIDNEKYKNATEASPVILDAYPSDKIVEVVAGKKNGEIAGYVITVVAGGGYGGDIKFSCGIGVDGTYLGTSILSINETAGLGMRAKQDPSCFIDHFNNVKTDSFTLVKDGTGATDGDDKVDAIGGSTVTSKAITNGINAALAAFKEINE